MNTKKLIAAVLLAATGFGIANAAEQNTAVGKSRAEVINELQQARASGELNRHIDYVFFDQQSTASAKTRAEVAAELKQARRQGELAVGDASYPVVPAAVTVRAKSDVKAEAVAAVKSRSVNHDYDIGG